MKHIVEYRLDYEHVVRVGVEADSGEDAKRKVGEGLDKGTLWEGSDEYRLLYDDFEEKDDNVLEFSVVEALPDGASWPEPDPSAVAEQRRYEAFQAARLLVDAYENGDPESVDWEDVDAAYRMALRAIGRPEQGGDDAGFVHDDGGGVRP